MNKRVLFSLAGFGGVLVVLWVVCRPDERPADGSPSRINLEDSKPVRQPSGSLPSDRIAAKDALGKSPAANGEALRGGVHGVVRGPGGPVAGATVYAYLSPESPAYRKDAGGALAANPAPLGEVRTRSDGEYWLHLPARWPGYVIDLGAIADGFERAMVTDVRVRGEPIRQDFALESGDAIAGRVVDSIGRSVAGLRVLATRKQLPDYSVPLMSPWLLSTHDLRLARRDSDYHESRAITDATGRFLLSGLVAGEYTLVAESFEWIFDPTLRVHTGDMEVLATAVRGVGIIGNVRDASTKEFVPRCFVEVAVTGSNVREQLHSGTSLGGMIALSWRLPLSEVPELLRFFVRVRAEGYVPCHREIEVRPADGLAPFDADLEPLPKGNLELSVHYDDGERYAGVLIAEYAEPEGGVQGQALLSREEPGLYRGSIPAGRWFLRVRTTGFLGAILDWRQDAEISPGGMAHADVVIPRGGVLVVRRPPESDSAEWSLVALGETLSGETTLSEEETVLSDIPAGEWTLQFARGSTLVETRQAEFAPGLRIEIDLVEPR